MFVVRFCLGRIGDSLSNEHFASAVNLLDMIVLESATRTWQIGHVHNSCQTFIQNFVIVSDFR